MDRILNTVRSNIFLICLFAFLFALHVAIPAYITSTFLSNYVGEQAVGIVYTLGAIATIIAFTQLPKLLGRFGNYRVTTIMIVADLLTTFILAFSQNPLILVIAFIINFVAIAAIGLSMDIFLESYSTDSKTGRIRGYFLTSGNIAWVISPLINSVLVQESNYPAVFLASAILLLPIILILLEHFRNFKDAEYRTINYWGTLKEVFKQKNIRGILVAGFLLQFFYSWMVIYTPIYLHDHLGFNWSDLNMIFSLMLLPFILIELPLGKLADSRWGEKEILSLGFIIMAISTALISYVTDHHFIIWIAILFMTRVGASMVEIMSETYFFKKIDATNLNLMDVFRTVRPWAYVLGPLTAILLLQFLPLQYLFLALGFITVIGLRYSLSLEDTL